MMLLSVAVSCFFIEALLKLSSQFKLRNFDFSTEGSNNGARVLVYMHVYTCVSICYTYMISAWVAVVYPVLGQCEGLN